jgi:SpoVK/Ycf46/Vps4 family AAA+-type ATPase
MARQDNSTTETLREMAARVRGTTVERGGIALFAGPDRAAMSAAADALANEAGATLYRVDLNRIVSKYIGETEKNLDAVFRDAEAAGAILFFDEADALFGSRTGVKDSHDRYANVDIGYLLKRLEAFSGLAILATNRREALDDAIARRVNYLVEFRG